MTPFMEYHPGGVKYIMSAAGKDGTKVCDPAARESRGVFTIFSLLFFSCFCPLLPALQLFNKFHAWVNIDYLLDKCLIGKLVGEDGQDIKEVLEEESETDSSEEEDEEDEFERMARENAAKNAGKNTGGGGAAAPAPVVSNCDDLD